MDITLGNIIELFFGVALFAMVFAIGYVVFHIKRFLGMFSRAIGLTSFFANEAKAQIVKRRNKTDA
jgi:hypothetical protein